MTPSAESERHLLYDTTEIETLVFAPADLVREVVAIRAQAPQWETWGDARADLSTVRFGELRDRVWGTGEPDDDEPLDTNERTDEQAWPVLTYAEVAGWLPDAVVEAHGERYEVVLDSGIHLPSDAQEDIVHALEVLGYRCTSDPAVAELFDVGG